MQVRVDADASSACLAHRPKRRSFLIPYSGKHSKHSRLKGSGLLKIRQYPRGGGRLTIGIRPLLVTSQTPHQHGRCASADRAPEVCSRPRKAYVASLPRVRRYVRGRGIAMHLTAHICSFIHAHKKPRKGPSRAAKGARNTIGKGA